MKKRMFIMLLAVVLVVAGIAYKKYSDIMQMKAGMAAMMSAPAIVSTGVAKHATWQDRQDAVGSIRASNGVDIAAELPGIVQEIRFVSGQEVKEGDLLVSLRADDEIAKLHTLEAALRLAETNLARDRKQFEVHAVSQSTIDNDIAALAVAKAQVAEQHAVVDKKQIKAPFAGKLGIRNIDLGQYINPGQSIVTLQALDSVYLDFTLPQQALQTLKVGQKLEVVSDAVPGKKFEGEISAINPKVEASTRNVQLRATLVNSEHALLPGMYATANIVVGEPTDHVTLPQTAISYNPYGNTVFVVDEKKEEGDEHPKMTARQVFVTLGEKRGDQVAVLTGVKDGETVVIAGQIKLQNGSVLKVDNTVTPTSDAHPQPEDK